ncbi:MAG TPA: acido-empty-quinoprotein group A [Bryobacteraceae bacterium]|jgi:alcohol dehydrogenase (cytochrome c)|nr:acido-empty-quinoprotein group A [Bryobacteraceae bacterium]
MNSFRITLTKAALALMAAANMVQAQSLDPAKPPREAWPTYNGDYSGRRFSPLADVNAGNVQSLSVAWMYRIANVGQQRGVGAPDIKSTPLMVDGVLYFTIPDHVYAVDARTGRELWHYDWEDQGGHLIGNRGVGMYGGWLYFMTPDDWFISLNAQTGKERWRKKVADEKMQYFTTMAPMVIGNHVIVGVGGDAMDVPGFLESRDPETGDVQWRWNTEPKPGEPGAETWPGESAMEHGGGMTWLPGTYDPELDLLYWGTGNPNPVYAGQSRRGDDLWTCSIVALKPETGKLVWYFQASPHDTHDWDNVETPVLFEATVDGHPRKLLAQAARNGYFFVLDRTNGKSLVSKPYVPLNWSKGLDARGEPIPSEKKEPSLDGVLLTIPAGGGTNWLPPSFDPETGLFYVNATDGYSLAYLTDTDEKPQGYGGSGRNLWSQHVLEALDYRTGNIAWRHAYLTASGGSGFPGILTTAGHLLFTGDYAGNLIAYNPGDGAILWHFNMAHSLSNGPETYRLDGRQYVVAAAGDTLFAFAPAK